MLKKNKNQDDKLKNAPIVKSDEKVVDCKKSDALDKNPVENENNNINPKI